jgi:hypothetical protein
MANRAGTIRLIKALERSLQHLKKEIDTQPFDPLIAQRNEKLIAQRQQKLDELLRETPDYFLGWGDCSQEAIKKGVAKLAGQPPPLEEVKDLTVEQEDQNEQSLEKCFVECFKAFTNKTVFLNDNDNPFRSLISELTEIVKGLLQTSLPPLTSLKDRMGFSAKVKEFNQSFDNLKGFWAAPKGLYPCLSSAELRKDWDNLILLHIHLGSKNQANQEELDRPAQHLGDLLGICDI